MNIDDILASVSNTERLPQRTADLQALTRAWVAERCAPELLPWPEELVERVMDRIKLQLDKYPHHHLPSPNLSPTESQYLTHRCSLLSHHFNTSFLSSFPAQLQKLDDTAGGISMVDGPDTEAAVFVRVLRDAGHVEVQGEQGVGVVELRRGDVWCVRWSSVKGAVLRGDVEMV
ncbi:hypothetical protein AUEXF2481DRAFT_184012 [Aureobasidium subglaciale EXF-2481]|uniref:DNA replication complex GINS protein SLD5 n=1 Tax=Aureobasidium subglaciale (strain EXF-2481) TaxID=1043005 RepID=A0A074ZMK4_AURSE|nr:uncharacterized protein AUEXF2481DRAFT_184012 [Aureobasidium subglaciale EXF-2481]KEQ99581.1 hypothetical protein AUEXF2481DRAFT_184012 [Aureobasidium subglaciale EXF-2481]